MMDGMDMAVSQDDFVVTLVSVWGWANRSYNVTVAAAAAAG